MRQNILIPALLVCACRPPAQEPPPPAPAAPVAALPAPPLPADSRFMQAMVPHHAQALEMTALVAARSSRQDIRALAGRIAASQVEEITAMERWLRARGFAVPAKDAHLHAASGHGELMPGMLMATELERLARSSGPEFDRLFLTYMIRHHEGALTMVRQLFSSRGAAQDPEIFRFATDVDADQRAEIRRMQSLLAPQ
jgi:uncharacterized protein (DUF305 family)